MRIEDLAADYDVLPRLDQARFLAYLFHNITIHIRAYYSDTAQVVNSRPNSKVGNLNEMQHQVANNLILVLSDEPDRPSGADLFIGELMIWAKNGQLEDDLITSLKRAMSYCHQYKQSN